MFTAAKVPVFVINVVPAQDVNGASADAITFAVVVLFVETVVFIFPVGHVPSESLAQPNNVLDAFLFSTLLTPFASAFGIIIFHVQAATEYVVGT